MVSSMIEGFKFCNHKSFNINFSCPWVRDERNGKKCLLSFFTHHICLGLRRFKITGEIKGSLVSCAKI